MSMSVSEKLIVMRESERLTRKAACEMTGVAYGSLTEYELKGGNIGMKTLQKILGAPRFKKYTMWFLFDEIDPEAGQIAPALAHLGRDGAELQQSDKSAG